MSPDAVSDQRGDASLYAAQSRSTAQRWRRIPQLRLQAGMPAEVFVKTPERTVLAYLAKSLRVFSNRSMREP